MRPPHQPFTVDRTTVNMLDEAMPSRSGLSVMVSPLSSSLPTNAFGTSL